MSSSSNDKPAVNAQARGTLVRISRWSIDHRRLVGIGWIALLVVVSLLASSLGTRYASDFSLAGTDSQRATDLLKRDFPAQAGDSDQVVFRARQGTIASPSTRTRIIPVLTKIRRLPHVTGVVSPYGPVGAAAISRDRRIAFATVTFDKRADELPVAAAKRMVSTAESARSSQLQVELGGQAVQLTQRASLGATTAIGLGAAIAILLITFGSLLAMGLPVVTALLGLGTGIGLIGIGTHVLDMPDFSKELAAMIGLGVGIDYSLFIVTRFRENYGHGADVRTAIVAAMDTAGRAVFFAGCTVVIALLGMFALGVSFLYGLAIAASLAVLMTMIAALTVLPALLSRFGERLGRRRRAKVVEAASQDRALRGFWVHWAELIQRHPRRGGIAGLAIMLVLASPALSLRLGQSDAGNDPTSLTTRRAYDLLAQGFGKGFSGPLLVVAQLSRANDAPALREIASTLRATSNVASVSAPRTSAQGETAVFSVYPRSAPQDQATTDLVSQLRSDRLPPLEKTGGATLLVGGITAVAVDFTHVLADKLPLFIGIVVLLSALLLFVVFRSLVIPIQAAIMNLLSIGASVGVVVAIFQNGWLGGVFGVQGGPIDAFLPVFLFAIVFGLSMDYEVFLVSRIHEEWTHRRDPSQAIARGLASTGRVITAAAAIMICVFLSFAIGDERVIKLFGLSLASAVFLDAFVVRCLLLPSVLELLGRTTWKLPGWLERSLPHLAIDAASVAAAQGRGDDVHRDKRIATPPLAEDSAS